MKASTIIMGLMAAIVSAQYPTDCTITSVLPGTHTITDYTVSTYCPLCDHAKENGDVYTTVYETTLVAVCPTGLSSAVYTVTNTCTGSTAIDTASCPPGFTTTAVACTACPGSGTVTITAPIVGPTKAATATYAASNSAVAGSATAAATAAKYTGGASFMEVSVAAGMGSVLLGMLML